LFDVNSNSTVEEMSTREIRVPWGVGIVGHVAKTGESCNVEDCYQDSRFNKEVDEKTGYCTSTMMCSPIMDAAGDVIGVSQVINKNNKNGNNRFSNNDEKVFEKYLQFCGIGLRNAQLYERSQLEVKRNQVLLDLAGVIFQEQSTLEHMIHRILTHLMCLIQVTALFFDVFGVDIDNNNILPSVNAPWCCWSPRGLSPRSAGGK
jgi:hypothetical protein